MRMIITSGAACFAVLAAGAATAEPRLTDVEFVQAARCAGLAEGSRTDAAPFNAVLKAQRQGRADYIRDKADQAHDQASHDIRSFKGDRAQKLIAERDGACAALKTG